MAPPPHPKVSPGHATLKLYSPKISEERRYLEMAKNWKPGEAMEALRSGDVDARIDIGRRFPLFVTATPEEIINALPDYVTVRKIESQLRGERNEDEAEDEVEETKPAKKAPAVKAAPAKKAPAKKRPADEDEDEDDEDEDDEVVAPVKKKAPAKKGPPAKAKRKPADDEDDDEDDDF